MFVDTITSFSYHGNRNQGKWSLFHRIEKAVKSLALALLRFINGNMCMNESCETKSTCFRYDLNGFKMHCVNELMILMVLRHTV